MADEQISESTEQQAPTKEDLAGLFKQFRGQTAEAEALAETEPTNVDAEPVADVQETQESEAEPQAVTEAEPEAPTAPLIPPPPGMSEAQVAAFNDLTPEMQQFVASQELSRTSDYQAKTTNLAHQRRELEALRSQYGERLQQQIDVLQVQTAEQPKPPHPDLRDQDPDEYERQRDAYILSVHEGQERQAQLQDLQARQLQEQQRAAQEFTNEQQALLPTMVPETADPAKRDVITKDVATYATNQGYTPHQLAGFTARDFKMLYQSMQWERAKRTAGQTGKAPKPTPPKAQRPGTAPSPGSPAGDRFQQAKKAFDSKPTQRNLAGMFAANRAARKG